MCTIFQEYVTLSLHSTDCDKRLVVHGFCTKHCTNDCCVSDMLPWPWGLITQHLWNPSGGVIFELKCHSGKKTSLWFVASFYFQPKHAFKLGHWLYSPDWDSVKNWSHSHEVKSWSLRPMKVLPELSPALVVRVSIHLLSLQSQWHGDSTAQMLNLSRLVFDWSWVHKDQGSEGHFYHFAYAGSTSPLRLLWLWDLYINTSLWEGCGHLKLLPIIWMSTVLLWTPAIPLRASNAAISGIREDLGVLL